MGTKGGLLLMLMIFPCFLYRESACTLIRNGITQLQYVEEYMDFDQAEKRCEDEGSSRLLEFRSELEWNEVMSECSI